MFSKGALPLWFIKTANGLLLWKLVYKQMFNNGNCVVIETECFNIDLYEIDIKTKWPTDGFRHVCYLVEEIIDHSDKFPEPLLLRHYLGKLKTADEMLELVRGIEAVFHEPIRRYNSFEYTLSDLEISVVRQESVRRWMNVLIF